MEPDSDVLGPDQWAGDGNDLKEHVVGILFSRSKLSHLQKQVCSHIVTAIAKEASVLRDEWEIALCSGLGSVVDHQGWKFVSCCHGQELGQLADPASDWFVTFV